MRLSFKTRPQHSEWQPIVDFWKEGDRIDLYDAGWTFDHLDPIFSDRSGPVYEGWTMLAALSGIVHRLRLGVLVTGNTYRHPSVLANMASTLDVASGGRLEIGLGTGWIEPEHAAYDIPLPSWKERFDRLEETCEILHLLFTEEITDFDGPFHRLENARALPKPIQKPHPPIVIGGTGEKRTLRIAALWADQWNLPGGDPDMLRHKIGVLHAHCADVGRDPAEIEVSAKLAADGDPAELADLVGAFREAGADHIIAMFEAPFDPARLGIVAEHLEPVIR
ncbi:MAG: TIGR03560 family F420-dependent LLM class oxidoreductase [Acidimicrobiia bacterium]